MFKLLNTTLKSHPAGCGGVDLCSGSQDHGRCLTWDLGCILCDGGRTDFIEGCNSKHDVNP